VLRTWYCLALAVCLATLSCAPVPLAGLSASGHSLSLAKWFQFAWTSDLLREGNTENGKCQDEEKDIP
jgi:hypothetical protein